MTRKRERVVECEGTVCMFDGVDGLVDTVELGTGYSFDTESLRDPLDAHHLQRGARVRFTLRAWDCGLIYKVEDMELEP
jgi:hypothetical protein